MKERRTLLTTELGSKIFSVLLNHSEGISGYKLTTEINDGGLGYYRGKTVQILNQLETEGLLASIKTDRKTGQELPKNADPQPGSYVKTYKVDFEGLAELYGKAQPKGNEFTKEEITILRDFFASIDWKGLFSKGKSLPPDAYSNLGRTQAILNPKNIDIFSAIGFMMYHHATIIYSNKDISGLLRWLKVRNAKILADVIKKMQIFPKHLLLMLAANYIAFYRDLNQRSDAPSGYPPIDVNLMSIVNTSLLNAKNEA